MGLTLLSDLLKQRFSLELDRLSLSLRLLAVPASFLHASRFTIISLVFAMTRSQIVKSE